MSKAIKNVRSAMGINAIYMRKYDGQHIDFQIKVLKEEARKKGCSLTFYVDDGRKLKRTEFMKLQRDVKAGKVSSLRIYDYDRLFRPFSALRYLTKLTWKQ